MILFYYFVLFIFCLPTSFCAQKTMENNEEAHYHKLKDMYFHTIDVLKAETHGPLCSQLTRALNTAYDWTSVTPTQKPHNFSSLLGAVEKTIKRHKALIPKHVFCTLNELNRIAKKKKRERAEIIVGVMTGTAVFLAIAALFIRLKLLKKTTGGSASPQLPSGGSGPGGSHPPLDSSAAKQEVQPEQQKPLATPPDTVSPLQKHKQYAPPNSSRIMSAPDHLVDVENEDAKPREELNITQMLLNVRRSLDVPGWILQNRTHTHYPEARLFYAKISPSDITQAIDNISKGDIARTDTAGNSLLIAVIEDIALMKAKAPITTDDADKILSSIIDSKAADIDHQNNFGLTALHYACWYKQYLIIESLLQKNANPNITSKTDALYPLDLLLMRSTTDPDIDSDGHLGYIKALCDKMDPKIKKSFTRSPFISALCFSDEFTSIEILCQEGFDFNKLDHSSGSSPIEYAIEERRIESIRVLIKYKALIDQKTIDLFDDNFSRNDCYRELRTELMNLPRSHTTTVDTEMPVVVYGSEGPVPPPRRHHPNQTLSAKQSIAKGFNAFRQDLKEATRWVKDGVSRLFSAETLSTSASRPSTVQPRKRDRK